MSGRSRAWRRKRTEAVHNRRCKEQMSMARIFVEDIIRKDKSGKVVAHFKKWRKVFSWKEFKDKVKWAHLLRDQGCICTDVYEQIEAHSKVKKERANNKSVIADGVQEYVEDYCCPM